MMYQHARPSIGGIITSRVRVDAPICDHETIVEAERSGDETMVRIISGCKSVQGYADRLKKVSMSDLMDLEGSKIMKLASESGLTPTCLVPVAVYNVCWMEHGLISKRLAIQKKRICIEFLD
jgi:hypothetical protein